MTRRLGLWWWCYAVSRWRCVRAREQCMLLFVCACVYTWLWVVVVMRLILSGWWCWRLCGLPLTSNTWWGFDDGEICERVTLGSPLRCYAVFICLYYLYIFFYGCKLNSSVLVWFIWSEGLKRVVTEYATDLHCRVIYNLGNEFGLSHSTALDLRMFTSWMYWVINRARLLTENVRQACFLLRAQAATELWRLTVVRTMYVTE